MPALVSVADLADFPGAPFVETRVESAGEAVRAEAGWHIAPVLTETLTVDGEGGHLLFLPSLRVLEVTEIRDVTYDEPRVITGWRKSKRGVIYRAGGWPVGFESIEVDVVHGYAACPAELLPVIAEYTTRRVTQESLGSRSVSFASDEGARLDSRVARYKIPSRP
jgi:hypothetical protein